MPFFTCRNHLLDKDIQKDINRYIYCTTFNIPPFKGHYGAQPTLWEQKSYIIKKALASREKSIVDKQLKDRK